MLMRARVPNIWAQFGMELGTSVAFTEESFFVFLVVIYDLSLTYRHRYYDLFNLQKHFSFDKMAFLMIALSALITALV